MQDQASTSWVGLLLFVGAMLFQLYSSYKRGKVEPEEPVQQPAHPVQTQRSPSSSGTSLQEVFDQLAKGPRVSIKESQSPSLQDDPAGLIRSGGNPLYQTSVERLAVPIGDVPIVTTSHESEVDHFSWLRLRLQDRSETQRAIILNEVLQPPIAMR